MGKEEDKMGIRASATSEIILMTASCLLLPGLEGKAWDSASPWKRWKNHDRW